MAHDPAWLEALRALRAIGETGRHYTMDAFDRGRFEQVSAIAERLLAERLDISESVVRDAFVDLPGYVTPKIDVRGACFRDGRILLVREASDGRWAMPGGFADVNLTPGESVLAEIEQESGFTARIVKLAALHDRRRRNRSANLLHIYKLFFLCELTGGSARPSIETTEIGFFAEDEIPDLSNGRTSPEQVQLMFRHLRDPDLAAEWD
jgi:ADP-ribose pyrophosphatase YjhB (NUDIX family)